MTRLITMVAVSGLVLGIAAPALWAADAPSTSPSAVSTQPSTAPAAQNSASMPQTATPAQNTAAAPQAAAPAPLTTAQAAPTTVKPVRRIYRPSDHMANELNRQELAQINAVNASNYGSSR